MKALIRRLLPQRIASQITLLVFAAVVLFHIAISVLFFLRGPDDGGPPPDRPLVHRLVALVQVLDALPAAARPEAVEAMKRAYPDLDIRLGPQGQAPAGPTDRGGRSDHRIQMFARDLGPGFHVTDTAPGPQRSDRVDVVIELRDHSMISASVSLPPPRRRWALRLILATLGFVALNVTLLSWWASRGLTAPLTRFSQAAEEFSLDRDPAPLADEGPDEIRAASRALNRLRARIRAMVEDRTRMLAAVSHDLRTPITRLRLRAEFIEDEAVRAPILRDLKQMDGMVHAALSYLRNEHSSEAPAPVELSSLLQTIATQFADMGEDVRYEGPDHLVVHARSDELLRAVTNLVENAVKFGKRAVVQLRPASPNTVEIDVVDDGPGIPEAQQAAMLEPFARGDKARGMEGPAGFGLGLAIARAIAASHGGSLILVNRRPKGLIARLLLPIAGRAAETVRA